MATKPVKKAEPDSFEKLNKDCKTEAQGVYGMAAYRIANGSKPCYVCQQHIPPGEAGNIPDEAKRRYINLCRAAKPADSLIQFTVTAKEAAHKDWLNVFCEYMDEGATLLEARSVHQPRYKTWLFTIHATGK